MSKRYSIKKLADIAGVSTRTLRWYEQQGLLRPKREANGYRTYGEEEVKRLQQILLYRELGFELKDIVELLSKDLSTSKDDLITKLTWQLQALKERRTQLDALIANVERTIAAEKKGTPMSDTERFEAFKQKALEENERKYGTETREKYGEETAAASNAKFAGLSEEQYKNMEQLTEKLHAVLREATAEGDPTSKQAQELAKLHKEWLLFYWPSYSKEQHCSVVQMYVEDPRFKKHYEEVTPGGAEFLRDAVLAWTES